MCVLYFLVLCGILTRLNVVSSAAIRPVEYVAPANPCREEDRLCSTKCVVMKMRGDFKCEFCVCYNKDNYVTWETSPDPSMTSLPSTTLPPGVIVVNHIKYIQVQDYCDLARDRMCPSTCDHLPSVMQNGTACTQCDCKGVGVPLGK